MCNCDCHKNSRLSEIEKCERVVGEKDFVENQEKRETNSCFEDDNVIHN